ncbi:MAG: endonuclease/exonuclease/phosphatase family protein [Pseudomonadota bacterium]
MPNANSLEYGLELINSLGKSFLNQYYFSGFYRAKDELANLAALNSFELNSMLEMELGASELKQITEGIEKKKNAASGSPFAYLRVCSEAIESLRKWSVMDGHMVEKHLLDTLSKVLNPFISSSSDKIESGDLEKEMRAVEKHINNVEAINNFFKLLKKINQTELKDIELEKLLEGIDINRGLIVPAEDLTKEITRLIKDVYSYLDKKLSLITINNNEDQVRKKNFLLKTFEALAPLQQINLTENLPFANSDISHVNDLLKNYHSREVFLVQVDRLLLEIKANIEDKAWNSKAKNTIGPPDGIRKLRKIFNNTDLGPFEKLFSAREFLEKKFKRLNRRDTSTSYFYDSLSRKLDALYKNFGRDYEEGRKALPEAKFLLPFYWKSEDSLALTKIVTAVEDEVEQKDEVLLRTYNIQQIISSPQQKKRASQLVPYLQEKNDDIIILEEGFRSGFLQESVLARDYHIIKPKGFWLINSGVCILLKKETFDFETFTQETYTSATSVDRLVPKGFTHIVATQRSDNKKVHIIGTHTQAQYAGPEIIVTLAQLAQLGEYISKLPEDASIILAGDLNIPRDKIEFNLLRYLLPLDDQPTAEGKYSYDFKANPLAKDEQSTLDYVASRGYEKKTAEIEIDSNTKAISDHFPVFIKLKPRNLALEGLSVIKEQDPILSKLIRFVYKQAVKLPSPQAKKLHFSASNLAAYIGNLSVQEREKLGTGDRFLDACLRYKPTLATSDTLAEEMHYSFRVPSKQIPSLALEELIDYQPFASLLNELPMVSSKEEDAIFSNVYALLIKAQDVVGSQIWDKRGRDIFYRESKCPDGIKAIRSCVRGTSLEVVFPFDPKALIPLEKVKLLKKYLTLHELVTKKSSNNSSLPWFKYRQIETQHTYEKLAKATTSLFGFFSKSQLDILKVIKKYNKGTENDQSIESLNAIKTSEEGNAIFNVEPIITSCQQEKFKEALESLDYLIPRPQAPTHYMGL